MIKNLTNQDINIMTETGEIVTFPAERSIGRFVIEETLIDRERGCEIVSLYDARHSLPEEREGIYLVVPAKLREALHYRRDLISTGRQVLAADGVRCFYNFVSN